MLGVAREIKIFFILTFSFYLLSNTCCSIEISSDYLEYDQKNNKIIANGNVIVKYKAVELSAQDISFDINNEEVHAKENVILKIDNKEINSEKMTYNFNENKGLLNNTFFKFRNTTFYSTLMKLNKDNMHLLTTNFTLCKEEKKPHFRIKADKLIFIGDKKIIVRNAHLYINDRRIIRWPYLTLPLKKKEKKLALLNFGVNTREILYAKSYYTYSIPNLGNIESIIYLPINIKKLQYTLSLSKENIYELLFEKKLNKFETKKDTYIRKAPEIIFTDKRKYKYFSCNSLLKLGKIYDEDENIKSNRIATKIELKSKRINMPKKMELDTSVYYSLLIYDKLSYQDKCYSLSLYTKNFSISYINHKLEGVTPFHFDKIDIEKELYNNLKLNFKKVDMDITTRYDLENNKIYDNIFSMDYKLTDCITLTFDYFKKKNKVRIEFIVPIKEFMKE